MMILKLKKLGSITDALKYKNRNKLIYRPDQIAELIGPIDNEDFYGASRAALPQWRSLIEIGVHLHDELNESILQIRDELDDLETKLNTDSETLQEMSGLIGEIMEDEDEEEEE